jgi:hypothetical protein
MTDRAVPPSTKRISDRSALSLRCHGSPLRAPSRASKTAYGCAGRAKQIATRLPTTPTTPTTTTTTSAGCRTWCPAVPAANSVGGAFMLGVISTISASSAVRPFGRANKSLNRKEGGREFQSQEWKAPGSLPAIAKKWSIIAYFGTITTYIALCYPITTDSCHAPKRYVHVTKSERHPVLSVFLHNISRPVNNRIHPHEGEK